MIRSSRNAILIILVLVLVLSVTIIVTTAVQTNNTSLNTSVSAAQHSNYSNNDESKCGRCYNGSYCDEETGKCVCWPHFTNHDCAFIACDENSDPFEKVKQFCPCHEGWSGLLCQNCKSAEYCEAAYGHLYSGQNGTWVCDQSVFNSGTVHEKWYQCDLLDGELTQLIGDLYTVFWCLGMNDTQNGATCQMQVYSKMGYPPGEGSEKWPVGKQSEIFYCVFDSCHQQPSTDPNTGHEMNTISCESTRCGPTGHYPYPDFLKDQLDMMTGKGSVVCDNVTKLCTMTQEQLQFMFETNCTNQLGECVFMRHNETRPPVPPPPDIPDEWAAVIVRAVISGLIIGSVVLASVICLCSHCIYSKIQRKRNFEFWKEINEEGKMGADLTFRNISYTLNLVDFATFKTKRILDNINGHVPRGSMLAIMGSSGAGKSSLLDILAGRKKSGEVRGDIFVNGKLVDKRYQLMKGYVLQDNVMMETMTVRELLMFSAEMRLPEFVSTEEKVKRVEQTLLDLDIMHIAGRRVGGTLKRGISGGEKRRVAIGMELVVSPSILFLDEPISGLDSYNALSVITILRELSQKGKTIIFSIHQPSSSIFALFDQLLLLSEGRCCYFGSAQHAKQHFESLGYQFPADHNPADVMVEVAIRAARDYREQSQLGTIRSGMTELDRIVHAAADVSPLFSPMLRTPNTPLSEETSALLDRQSQPSDGGRNGVDMKNVNSSGDLYQNSSDGDHTDHLGASLTLNVGLPSHRIVSKGTGRSARKVAGVEMYLTTFYKQFWHLAWRSFKNFLRNPLLLPAHLLLALAMGVFLGCIYWQQELDFYGSQNRLGAMFFMCAMFGFGAMTSLGLFVTERTVFVRERAGGYYRPEAYYLAKILFDIIPLRVLPPILFSTCAYWMIGLRPGIEFFATFVAFTVMFNIVVGGICLVIGVVCPNVALSNIIALAANLYFMLFGGFLINTDDLPPYLVPLKYTSPYRFAIEALMVNEFAGRTILFNPKGFPSIKMSGTKLLEVLGFNVLHTPMDAGLLFLMALMTLVGAGLLLRILVKEKL